MSDIPPPPPPPPPPPAASGAAAAAAALSQETPDFDALSRAVRLLERGRCLEAETEASLLWTSELLHHRQANAVRMDNGSNTSNNMNSASTIGAIQDAWVAWAAVAHHRGKHLGNKDMYSSNEETTTTNPSPRRRRKWQAVVEQWYNFKDGNSNNTADGPPQPPLPLPRGGGQWRTIWTTHTLHTALHHTHQLARDVQTQRNRASNHFPSPQSLPPVQDWLAFLDARTQEMQQYRAQSSSAATSTSALAQPYKRRRLGHPRSDGYDLVQTMVVPPTPGVAAAVKRATQFDPTQSHMDDNDFDDDDDDDDLLVWGDRFTEAQVLGKYLDWQRIYQTVVWPSPGLRSLLAKKKEPDSAETAMPVGASTTTEFTYGDFLTAAAGQWSEFNEADRNTLQAEYVQLLQQLEMAIRQHLQQTAPLVDPESLVAKPVEECQQIWQEQGGCPAQGFAAVPTERDDATPPAPLLDWETICHSAPEVLEKFSADAIAHELRRLGLKAGGAPLQRAERLWSIRGLPRDQWPAKALAKPPKGNPTAKSSSAGANSKKKKKLSRYQVCQLQVRVQALIHQVRPTLERTIAKVARAATQTAREAQQELEQDLYGSAAANDPTKDGENENDDDEEEPIYNPKNVPLDWDGKPIPYWLFKLHGLQHYFTCEICGGESYRGRHQFEIHFGDPKHSYGLQALGIPNTQHFHGITSIKDAQELHGKLQSRLQANQWDAQRDEEYEDSQGNVLSRQTYEDLGRQGLL